MKILINTFLLLITLLFFEKNSFALTDYQIREICKRERRRITCIRDMKEKRINLLEGNRIEIPVVPYKR